MSKEQGKKLKKYFVSGSFMVVLAISFIEPALASFDIDAGVAAVTHPLVDSITSKWGIGTLVLVGCGGLVFGSGDLASTKQQGAKHKKGAKKLN